MLENTLSTVIENLIEQHNLTLYQSNQLKQTVRFLEKDDYIYPGQLKSRLNLDIVAVYRMLEEMRSQGILERSYEIYCSKCHRFKGKILDTLTDMDQDATCDFCGNQFEPTRDTIMIYKVLRNE